MGNYTSMFSGVCEVFRVTDKRGWLGFMYVGTLTMIRTTL